MHMASGHSLISFSRIDLSLRNNVLAWRSGLEYRAEIIHPRNVLRRIKLETRPLGREDYCLRLSPFSGH